MKQNIHPENYRTVLFYDGSANEGWLIRAPTLTVKRWSGKTAKNIPCFHSILLPPRIRYIPANGATLMSKAAPASSTSATNP